MADLALVTANKVEVVESIEQKTLPAGVAITAGQPIHEGTAGTWVLALADNAANARNVYVATRTALAGEALTGIKKGYMDGWVLDALAFNAPVYLSDTSTLADTAGTVLVLIGYVRAAWGQPVTVAADKILEVDTQTVAVA
jgi:hypothetical protein